MPEVSAIIIAPDTEQRAVLQVLVDGTNVAHTIHASPSFPLVATDPLVRRIHGENAVVVLVDIPRDNPQPALRAIELLRQEVPELPIFAIGSLSQPQVIVNAMRSGAQEFLERPATTKELLEAFVRLTTAKRRSQRDENRGKMLVVINAKGGSGCTTVAVNLALALQNTHGNTALIDVAPLGHCALHLNLQPLFTVADAIRNMNRLDSSLLEGFMTRHSGGLHLLAGPNTPVGAEPSTTDYAKLFDLLVGHFRYVVVDISSRMDATTQLVANLTPTWLHCGVPLECSNFSAKPAAATRFSWC
jgi:pilus assembly protein CpaE